MSQLEELVAAARANRKPQSVHLTELDRTVFVRQLTASEWMGMTVSFQELPGGETRAEKENASKERAAIAIAAFLCDENGAPLASLDEARHLVAELPIGAITKIVTTGHKVNGNTGTAEDKEKN